MWQRVQEVFAEHFQLIYVSLGMIFSCIMQIYVSRRQRLTWADRAASSFVCALFTAAITVPILDYWPELPPSISLLIGSFCGSMGDKGIRQIMNAIAERFLGTHVNVPHEFPAEVTRRYHYSPKHDSGAGSVHSMEPEEPPMPDDIRERS